MEKPTGRINLNTNTDLPTPERQVLDAMFESLGCAPDDVLFDGQIHRFRVDGDKGSEKSGWYVLYGDRLPAGAFGSWKADMTTNWCAKVANENFYNENRAEVEAAYRRAREQREKEMKERHQRAAETCQMIWDSIHYASDDHPYLQRKGVKSHGLKQTGDGRLVMPIYIGAELTSLQYISDDGRKEFHTGGEISAGYFRIPARTVGGARYIVEGYATGASVHEATGGEVWVALNAGNLAKVGRFLRAKMPNEDIVFVGDNDKSGVGQKAATEAASEINARVIIPPDLGDVNDYAVAGKDLKTLLVGKEREKWLLPVAEFCADTSPIQWLIEDYVQEVALMMFFGASGAGKTFVVLDMALTIASPDIDTWHGRKVKHGHVAYLAGEGHRGLIHRIRGWMARRGADIEQSKIFVSKSAIDLNTGAGLDFAIDDIKKNNVQPSLVIIDTLNRFFVGDENKAQDTKTMLDACTRLQQEFNCAIGIVHHTGVSQEAQERARGSSAWKGAMDLEMWIGKPPGSSTVMIRQTKNKDAEPQPDLMMELVKTYIPGLYDDNGNPVSTAVPELMGEGEAMKFEKEKTLSKSQHFALLVYSDAAETEGMLGSDDKFQGMELNKWAEAYCRNSTGDNEESKRRSFRRARADLVELGFLKVENDIYTPAGLWGVFEREYLAICLQAYQKGG